MPIVDGITATTMIREAELNNSQSSDTHPKARSNSIPIFAVSASFDEKNEKDYIEAGFDGWVFKPIDFAMLNRLLAGINDLEVRAGAAKVTEWGNGGWFD